MTPWCFDDLEPYDSVLSPFEGVASSLVPTSPPWRARHVLGVTLHALGWASVVSS